MIHCSPADLRVALGSCSDPSASSIFMHSASRHFSKEVPSAYTHDSTLLISCSKTLLSHWTFQKYRTWSAETKLLYRIQKNFLKISSGEAALGQAPTSDLGESSFCTTGTSVIPDSAALNYFPSSLHTQESIEMLPCPPAAVTSVVKDHTARPCSS